MEEAHTFGSWGPTSEEVLKNQFPLHHACRDGDVEGLSLLIVEKQHAIYEEDTFYGWTPAHWASYFGKLACLRKLMIGVAGRGGEVNIRTSKFQQGPAHLAAFGGHPHCLQWLLQSGANEELQDYLGETPIHKAARTGSIECVSLLASHGAKLNIRNNNGSSPAQLAASCGYEECARYVESIAVQQDAESMQQGIHQELLTPVVPVQAELAAEKKPNICLSNQGINSGLLPPHPGSASGNGHSKHSVPEECEAMDQDMESDGAAGGAPSHGDMNGRHSGDVLLQDGVSTNQVPVAGKKRTLEESEEAEYKRFRRAGATQVESQTRPPPAADPAVVSTGNSELLKSYESVLLVSTEPLRLSGAAQALIDFHHEDSHYRYFVV